VPSGDGDEGNRFGVVSDLLDETGSLLDDFVESVLGPLAGVHLVASNDELPDTEGEGEQSVLSGLTILGDTSLELSDTGGNDKNGAVGLGGTSDHVLDEITVTRGVNDGDLVLGGLELPKSNVDGDTTLTLGLQFVEDPSVLEGSWSQGGTEEICGSLTLSELGSLLLELLNGSLVDTSTFVDQVTSGGGLSGVDVSDDDDVTEMSAVRETGQADLHVTLLLEAASVMYKMQACATMQIFTRLWHKRSSTHFTHFEYWTSALFVYEDLCKDEGKRRES